MWIIWALYWILLKRRELPKMRGTQCEPSIMGFRTPHVLEIPICYANFQQDVGNLLRSLHGRLVQTWYNSLQRPSARNLISTSKLHSRSTTPQIYSVQPLACPSSAPNLPHCINHVSPFNVRNQIM